MFNLRTIFMGTPELAAVSLQALLDVPAIEVIAVVTQPDRPKGRDLKLQASPVKQLANRVGVPVLQPSKSREQAFVDQMRVLSPELITVAAFGQILPEAILALPRFGCINVHTSLLPKYRGAAPIQWAVLNDESQTGVTIMKMDAGLDTGPILTQEPTPILPEDTAETLHARLARMGADLLVKTIPDLIADRIQPRPQPAEGVTLAPKIKKRDGQIDWHQTARANWNRVRGLLPWPGAFTFLPGKPKPHLLKIWRAEITESAGPPGQILASDKTGIVVACGQDSLRLIELQIEGGRRLPAPAFVAGHPIEPNSRLG